MSLTVAGLNSGGAAIVQTGFGGTPILTIGGSGTYNYGGSLFDGSTAGSLFFAFSGSGTQTLSGVNTISGTTTITSGELVAGSTTALSPNSQVTVNGGVLDTSGYANTVSSLTVASGGTLNVGIGNTLTSTGLVNFAGTLNISGTPSGTVDKLIAYSGSPTGIFATAPNFPNYALLYYSGQMDLQQVSGVGAPRSPSTPLPP